MTLHGKQLKENLHLKLFLSQLISSHWRVDRWRLLRLTVFFLVCFLAVQTSAQSPSATPKEPNVSEPQAIEKPGPEVVDVVKVDTSLVNIPVTVLDRHGKYVPNLARENFRIYEDGVKQSIAHFAPLETPFSVALVLDTSGSTRFRLEEMKFAALAFMDQLRPQDRVSVISFADNVDLLIEPTDDRKALHEAILKARQGSGTHLFDAVDSVLNEYLKRISGRKAMVLFTDGIDHTSSMATAIGNTYNAEETDSVIYTLQYDTFFDQTAITFYGAEVVKKTSRIYPPGLTARDYQQATLYLKELASRSGGDYYHADDLPTVRLAFARIAEQLRSQYSLGYYPAATTRPGPRAVRVEVDRPHLLVRGRRNFSYQRRGEKQ